MSESRHEYAFRRNIACGLLAETGLALWLLPGAPIIWFCLFFTVAVLAMAGLGLRPALQAADLSTYGDFQFVMRLSYAARNERARRMDAGTFTCGAH